jgi:tRNA A22 N-methylase
MKSYKDKEVYVKEDEVIFVGDTFIYEVSVFNYYKNYFSLVNSALYESPVFIEKTIRSFFVNKYTEICCELYQAPLEYLIENGYEPQTEINKRELKKTSRKTTRTRVKKL